MDDLSDYLKVEILNKLNDESLEYLFSTNKSFAKLNNELFWKDRVFRYFPEYTNIPDNISAKRWYKFLTKGYTPTEEGFDEAKYNMDFFALDIFFDLGMITSLNDFEEQILEFPILKWAWAHGFDVTNMVHDNIIFYVNIPETGPYLIPEIVDFFIDKVKLDEDVFTSLVQDGYFSLAKKIQDKWNYRLGYNDIYVILDRPIRIIKELLDSGLISNEELSEVVDKDPYRWIKLIKLGYKPNKDQIIGITSGSRSKIVYQNILKELGPDSFKENILEDIPIYKNMIDLYLWLIKNNLISEKMAKSRFILDEVLTNAKEEDKWNYLFKAAQYKNIPKDLDNLKLKSQDKEKLDQYLEFIGKR